MDSGFLQPTRVAIRLKCRHAIKLYNLIEHVFLGELLRGLWRKNVRDLEVLRPEVDSGG